MSFSPRTGFVYIPAIDMPYQFEPDHAFEYKPGHLNLSEDWGQLTLAFEGYEELASSICNPTRLIAWDPIVRKKAWENAFDAVWPGGVMSTAGDLVFQGNETGEFAAFDARDGRKLWSEQVGIGIMAAPVTYEIDGEQYVAVLAGMGGDGGTHLSRLTTRNRGRLLAWKLGAVAKLPESEALPVRKVEAPKIELTPERIDEGRALYARHCTMCHGFGVKSSGLYPDLRTSSREVHAQWPAIVLGGLRGEQGMASFADMLSWEQSEAIHAYVISRALHEPSLAQWAVLWLADHVCARSEWVTD